MKSTLITVPIFSKFLMVLIIGATFISLSGCQSTHSSQLSAPLSPRAESSPFKVKYTVGKKITGTVSASYVLGFQTEGPTAYSDGIVFNGAGGAYSLSNVAGNISPVNKLKAAATHAAVSEAGADVIIAPRYTVEDENYLIIRKLKVTVSGFKGNIKSVTAGK